MPETLEQSAEDRRQQLIEQWARIFGNRQIINKNASAKAKRLLAKFLTPEQQNDYQAVRHFTIVNGKKKYVIGDDLQVRVYDVGDYALAPPLETWCVRIPDTPFADTLIAQLLLLRSDPEKLRNMACVTPGRRRALPGYVRALQIIRTAGYPEPS
ncbi:MAG: hypothetical protein C5B60_05155 [Chloroflexi bacterium]|nr:MAG: hypothetical protein C5B60_05155 [Chloroflexota bacterium]